MEPSNANELMQAISTMGFPIVACCVMFYLYDKTLREVITTLQDLSTTLRLISYTLKETHKEVPEG